MELVEFIEDGHIYLVDGIITPSVSEILNKIFPNKYANVPQHILNAKAEYGSQVHEAIECLEQEKDLPMLDFMQESSVESYKDLKEEHRFQVVKQEEIIHYKDLFCGRYDMIIDTKEFYRCLADIKTTSKLDKDSLSWQLSLYELAYEYTFNKDPLPFHKFYCVWLPKKAKAQFVEIKRIPRDELLKKLEELGYEE